MIQSKKKSFTLVETMLVLSIIGVLVALMIPILDRSKPDETTLKYRKSFFGLEEAVRNLANDQKLYADGDFMNPVNIPSGATYAEVFCQNIANTLNTIGKIECHKDNARYDKNTDIANANQVNFRTTGGVSFAGLNNDFENEVENTTAPETLTICVDVNGFNEDDIANVNNLGCAPLSRAAEKRDQFRIKIDRYGRVYTGSSTGNNNWGVENAMLVDPRSVTVSKDKRTETEKAELKIAGQEGSDKPAPATPSCPSYYTWNGKNCEVDTTNSTDAPENGPCPSGTIRNGNRCSTIKSSSSGSSGDCPISGGGGSSDSDTSSGSSSSGGSGVVSPGSPDSVGSN